MLSRTLRFVSARALRGASCARGFAASPEFGLFPNNQRIPYVSKFAMQDPSTLDLIPCYRVMDESGEIRPGATDPDVGEEQAVHMYKTMCQLQTMDTILYEAQRQGRVSFYMTCFGEEGTLIGSAAGLHKDDTIYGQYRESGVLMYRGFTLQQFADQCFSNIGDSGKGRQMPVHYGAKELNFQTISSPLATQLPQAAGAAYALKLAGAEQIVVCYFGEGSASEGDFHAAMNFAATLEAPVMFFCRNNGYAISTPVKDQYRGDGIASRAAGYGMASVRVDGNDVWAVYDATRKARQYALERGAPVLVEAMSYRRGHHSTSDDSTRYRSAEEIEQWKSVCPIARMRKYLERRGWWDEARDAAARKQMRKDVLQAMVQAEGKPKPEPVAGLFEDVFATVPEHLQEQRQDLLRMMEKYPEHYTHGGH